MSVTFSILDVPVVAGDKDRRGLLFLTKTYEHLDKVEQFPVGSGEEGRDRLAEIAKVIDEYLYPWDRSGELPASGEVVELLMESGRITTGFSVLCYSNYVWIIGNRAYRASAVVGWRELRKA